MFAAGHDFFAEVNQREYFLRLHNYKKSSTQPDQESESSSLIQYGRGQKIISLNASGNFLVVITSFPLHGVGIAQEAAVYEYDDKDHENDNIRQVWCCRLPPQLYNYSSSPSGKQKRSSSSFVSTCVERGGEGGIAIGWTSSDVVAIFEPPVLGSPKNNNISNNNNNGDDDDSVPTFVVCKKRLEHSSTSKILVCLGSDLLFTISGDENRLQSWVRKSGDVSREGGTLSTTTKVASMTYEPSEAVLIVGFETGTVRLISVEKHSQMVTLTDIDIFSTVFKALGTTLAGMCNDDNGNNNNFTSTSCSCCCPVLNSSVASASSGECLIVTSLGMASLNLRTHKTDLKMEFVFDYEVEAAVFSSSNEFALVGPFSDGNHFEVVDLLLPTTSGNNISNQKTNQDHFSVSSNNHKRIEAKWSHRLQVGDGEHRAPLAIHDDASSVYSVNSSSIITTNRQTPMEFNFAQHSNISCHDEDDDENGSDDEDDNDDDYNEDEEEVEEEIVEMEQNDDDVISNIEPDQSDVISVANLNDVVNLGKSPIVGMSSTTWKRDLPASSATTANNRKSVSALPSLSSKRPPPPFSTAPSKRPGVAPSMSKPTAATSMTTTMTRTPATNAGSKFTVSNTKATSQIRATATKTTTTATIQPSEKNDEDEDEGNGISVAPSLSVPSLFILSTFNQELPASFKNAFEISQEKQDPNAKPVTFRRGGPVKSSGYSSTSNVPWSVQQAEKQKKKKIALQQQAAKAKQQQNQNFVPAPIAVPNYNTAGGVISMEHEKVNSLVLDKSPLHSATITTSCFDLFGNILFTGSNDGTCHVLKFGTTTLFQGGKYEGQAFSSLAGSSAGATTAMDKNDSLVVTTGQTTATSGNNNGGGQSSSVNPTSATTVTNQILPPVLSLDVGIGQFDPSSASSRTASVLRQMQQRTSWNVFATGSVGGAVTVWAPNPLQSGGVSPKLRHYFAKDAKSVRFCMRDSLLLVANGGNISTCRYALDLHRDELHRGRNLSRFAVVAEFASNAQSVCSIDTFNTLDSSLVVYGTSSKQVGALDLRRPDTAVWVIDDAHARSVHSVALQRCSAFSDVASPEESFALFASASVDNCVKLWDLRTRNAARVLNKHTNTALQLGLCMSPCARFVACGSEDRSVVIYDVAMGRILSKMRCPDQATTLRYHPLKSILFAGLANGKSKVFCESGK